MLLLHVVSNICLSKSTADTAPSCLLRSLFQKYLSKNTIGTYLLLSSLKETLLHLVLVAHQGRWQQKVLVPSREQVAACWGLDAEVQRLAQSGAAEAKTHASSDVQQVA